jgi:membrane-bound lytic murein transglycosylase F
MNRSIGRRLKYLISILIGLMLVNCAQQPTLLDQVRQDGQLIVVTRNSPTTYYQGAATPLGMEYELASRFAEYLGVELKIVTRDNFNEILPMVMRGKAQIAAAGLTVTDARTRQVKFGPAYQSITQQLVYRIGGRKPRTIADLAGARIEVIGGSSHAEHLRQMQAFYPELTWHEVDGLDTEELMQRLEASEIDYTIADSNEMAQNQRFYPSLGVAFDISEKQQLAWAFQHSDDDSLLNAAEEFFDQMNKSKKLAQLMERYYGHVETLDYVGLRTYLADIRDRLPDLLPLFRQAGEESGIDWRLLAAMGYQESHWDADAVSHTGVRGIMMLTNDAAREVGVANRRDPAQSILGGARYYSMIRSRIADDVPEPARTWMALAAYNVGPGHVDDARKLAVSNGGDPDKWVDVKNTLPLLSQRKWFVKTRLGYARGREPVQFVANVRNYYDILVAVMGNRDMVPAESVPVEASLNAPSISAHTLSIL